MSGNKQRNISHSRRMRLRNPFDYDALYTLVHELIHLKHRELDQKFSNDFSTTWFNRFKAASNYGGDNFDPGDGVLDSYALFDYNHQSHDGSDARERKFRLITSIDGVTIASCDRKFKLPSGLMVYQERTLKKVSDLLSLLPGNLINHVDMIVLDAMMNYQGDVPPSESDSEEYLATCEDVAVHAEIFYATFLSPLTHISELEMIATNRNTADRLDILVSEKCLDLDFREIISDNLTSSYKFIKNSFPHFDRDYIDAIKHGYVLDLD